jgi:PPK2 family polyphosphate:nucleotide phosphotransferase
MSEIVVVRPGHAVALSKLDPAASPGLDKAEGKARLAHDADRIRRLQERLYAESRRALLVVLQGMDASGKDGTIRHVFDAVSPLGLEVASFGRPSAEELDHDFLWRVHRAVPRYGNVGVFNRSHYEDVVVARVRGLVPPAIWRRRFDQINAFEALLGELGIKVVKCFLHISRAEQKERLEARLDDPAKRYKFDPGDLDDRDRWDDFVRAYEEVFARCSPASAPWHIVPADHKWFRNAAIARLVADTLDEMRPRAKRRRPDVVVPD